MSKNIVSIKNYKSPFGELIIGCFNDKLVLCDWKYRKMRTSIDKRISTALNCEFEESNSAIIKKTIHQLEEYFQGVRYNFDIPLQYVGTEFQQSVWSALVEIPFGKTNSYLQLSKSLGNEKAIRAVASANGANAISIIVPCHRIIGSNGELTGYAGGLSAKKRLLELEGANQQLNLF